MGRKVKIIVDVTELGSLGGKARARNLSAEELTAGARTAANARWQQYYRDNPEKLKERKERDARKTGEAGSKARKGAKGKVSGRRE
jgi:hypothetical protein